MGIIIKESFNQTAIRIFISVLGAIGTIFIYPLDRALYGVIGNVLNTAVLLMPFVVLGLGQASIRFFPYTSDSFSSRVNFLKFLAQILLVNIILFTLLFFTCKDWIIAMGKNTSLEYAKYFIYSFPGALLYALVGALVAYISNYKIVALPVGLQSMYRVAVPIAFLLIYFDHISIASGILLVYLVLVIALILLLYLIKKNIKRPDKANAPAEQDLDKKGFFQFYFWAFASSLGAMFAFKIDAFMVPWLTDFTLGGDYMIALVIIGVIVIPTSSVIAIAHPIISQAWKDNDLEEIHNVYHKGSKNLLFVGSVMLIGIMVLLDLLPIFLDTWKDLGHLKLIVLILGAGKLFDMASSVNGVIIAHSQWFRYNTWFVLVLVFLNVILNYVFLVNLNMGLIGAALATVLSLILFNALKTILLYIKIDFHPFDLATILFMSSLALVLWFNYSMHNWVSQFLALGINILVGAAFVLSSLFLFNFAPDSKTTFFKLLNKIIKS